jgi:cation/acetate symporter
MTSIAIFLFLMAGTLLITGWAAGRTKSSADFYVAHSRITPWQNSLAIAGEYISAGTLLGNTALFFDAGVDAFIYPTGALLALALMLFVVGERLRNLGKYSFADVCALRFRERPIRTVAALNTLSILLLLTVGQLVGAGALVEIVFGIRFETAVVIAGMLITIYVIFGGMLATTWVQIVKALLLLAAGGGVAMLVLMRFQFGLDALFTAASSMHKLGRQILAPGAMIHTRTDAFSIGLTLIIGPLGLPHVLMRFFTVRDGRAASRSIVYATLIIGMFYLLLAIFGFGAAALLTDNSEYITASGGVIGGENMVLLHLTHAVGGDLLFGAMAAIAFATTLAVISGVCLSASATIAHDLYTRGFKANMHIPDRRQLLVSRIAVAGFSSLATLLAIAMKGQNIVFLAALGVSIAASSNVPALIASMYWRHATTRGVIAGSVVGLATALLLIVCGPTMWVGVLHHAKPLYPYQYPTIVSLPLAIAALIIVSMLDRGRRATEERAAFDRIQYRSLTGLETQA